MYKSTIVGTGTMYNVQEYNSRYRYNVQCPRVQITKVVGTMCNVLVREE
jgi:hypothetical protein